MGTVVLPARDFLAHYQSHPTVDVLGFFYPKKSYQHPQSKRKSGHGHGFSPQKSKVKGGNPEKNRPWKPKPQEESFPEVGKRAVNRIHKVGDRKFGHFDDPTLKKDPAKIPLSMGQVTILKRGQSLKLNNSNSTGQLEIADKTTGPLFVNPTQSTHQGRTMKSRSVFSMESEAATPPGFETEIAEGGNSMTGSSSPDAEREKEKLSQVSKRLESTGRYFKRLGGLGFWSQLVCTVVSSVILAFSVVITGSPTSPATFYMTAVGIVAAFLSVFWSFGYIRLAERLRKTANDPAKAPPRADVVKNLKNGIVINILGMGATVLGMQATVGLLVAKALTSSANPYYQGLSPAYSPVLALDVFLVQACGNTLLSHFLGLLFSLELLRSVTLPSTPENVMVKLA